MNVITGGAGFIGSHLTSRLEKEDVVVYDSLVRGKRSIINLMEAGGKFDFVVGDVLDFEKLKETIKDGVDVIYHLAALPSHRLALTAPHDYAMVDLAGTANVLEAARLCNPKPLVVFASSNKVYGKQECPWREDKLPQPEGPYAVAKWGSEKLCEMYNKYFDVPCVVLRYHHVAGARSNPDLVLSIFTEQALKGEDLKVHGRFDMVNGFIPCSADYTHVDDAVRATILAKEKYDGFEIFNIANKQLTFIRDMAEMVIEKTNSKSKIINVPMLSHETLKHHSDVSKAEEKLGFVAEIPVEEAIKDYIYWWTGV